jgi:predicted transglutaminase-like cysteine proteinase
MGSFKGRARSLAALTLGLLATLSPSTQANAGMTTGGPTSQPIGHFEFCKRQPGECSIRSRDDGPVQMTKQLRTVIATVNVAVNNAIKPMNDFDIFGRDEFWTYPASDVGDCEDYVLLKRRMLMSKGIGLSNLLITVVRKPDGEGHAVLTVRTDRGDFVLDNLNNAVRPWETTGYRYLKRQASDHSGRWVSIRDGDTMMVGSVASQ